MIRKSAFVAGVAALLSLLLHILGLGLFGSDLPQQQAGCAGCPKVTGEGKNKVPHHHQLGWRC